MLALLWTGLVALTHQLSGWLLSALDTGAAQGAAGAVGALSLPALPAWLSPWLDAGALETLQSMLVSMMQTLGSVMPSGDMVMAWVGPLLWVGWALLLVPMLALAGLLHWLIGKVPVRLPPAQRNSA